MNNLWVFASTFLAGLSFVLPVYATPPSIPPTAETVQQTITKTEEILRKIEHNLSVIEEENKVIPKQWMVENGLGVIKKELENAKLLLSQNNIYEASKSIEKARNTADVVLAHLGNTLQNRITSDGIRVSVLGEEEIIPAPSLFLATWWQIENIVVKYWIVIVSIFVIGFFLKRRKIIS